MSEFVCSKCQKSLPNYMHWSVGICSDCVDDELKQVDDGIDHAQLEHDLERVQAEREEAFDAARAAEEEMAERELCRRRLLPFVIRSNPDYIPGWVHADICQRLEKFAEAIERGESPRLMINMPPRHGKSELASKTFPSWYLGRNKDHEVITCSYSGDLAKDFSRKCRDLLETDEFKTVFPRTRLSRESKSVEKWSTTGKGGFTAAGVQGPITGRGAHLAIIDDPVKDREEAESETTRQKVKDWYSSTFYTRLAPGGGVLIIQTRWHEDDLSGWLLDVMSEAEREMAETGEWPVDADRWDVVQYPAVALEDEEYRLKGEALHEDRYPLPALNKIKRAMIPRDWEALYQQRPVSDDGDYFTKDMFHLYEDGECPKIEDLRVYSAYDLAISKTATADYTVGGVAGIDRAQDIWILDIYRGRWGSLEIIDQLFDMKAEYDPELIGLEAGQIELTLEPFILKAEEERGISLAYEKLKTRGMDKVARARTIQGRMQQGKVHLPKNHPLTAWLMNEMLKFPLGKHDDGVDMMAWLGQMINLYGIVNQKQVKKYSSLEDRLRKMGYGHALGDKRRSAMSA